MTSLDILLCPWLSYFDYFLISGNGYDQSNEPTWTLFCLGVSFWDLWSCFIAKWLSKLISKRFLKKILHFWRALYRFLLYHTYGSDSKVRMNITLLVTTQSSSWDIFYNTINLRSVIPNTRSSRDLFNYGSNLCIGGDFIYIWS